MFSVSSHSISVDFSENVEFLIRGKPGNWPEKVNLIVLLWKCRRFYDEQGEDADFPDINGTVLIFWRHDYRTGFAYILIYDRAFLSCIICVRSSTIDFVFVSESILGIPKPNWNFCANLLQIHFSISNICMILRFIDKSPDEWPLVKHWHISKESHT